MLLAPEFWVLPPLTLFAYGFRALPPSLGPPILSSCRPVSHVPRGTLPPSASPLVQVFRFSWIREEGEPSP